MLDIITYLLDHGVHLGIFIILALSLQLINGFAGMFSLGHHGFFAVGAYAAGAFILFLGPESHPALASGMVFYMGSLMVGAAAAGLFGLVVGVPCLRLRGDYLAIATLGFGEIVRIVAQNTESLGGPRGFEIPYMLIKRGVDTQFSYAVLHLGIVIVACIVCALTIRNIMRSTHGRALLAIREDEIAAELVGVNLTRYKVLAFVIGAGFAGLAGGLYVNYMTQVEPKEFNILKGIYILLFIVLGGMGSMSGTIMACFLLYGVDKIVLNMMPPSIQSWREVFFALLLVLMMILRPQGLLGNREIYQTRLWKKLFGGRDEATSGDDEQGDDRDEDRAADRRGEGER